MKKRYAIYPFFLLGLLSPALFAGQATIKWDHPEKFSDIQPNSSTTRMRFQKRVLADLSKYIQNLSAKKLPEDYKLSILVKDIDLAGYIQLHNSNLQRVVRDVDIPRIKLTYKLSKGSQIVQQGNAKLTDLNFLRSSNYKFRNTSFYYEKKLLSDWFNKSIEPLTK